MRKLAIAIFTLCLLEALGFFYTAWWAFSIFRSAGATTAQALVPAESEASTGLLILVAGILYSAAPRLRLPLAVSGVFGGLYATFLIVHSPSLFRSWNLLHGDLIALGTWSEAILILLALLCATELTLLARARP